MTPILPSLRIFFSLTFALLCAVTVQAQAPQHNVNDNATSSDKTLKSALAAYSAKDYAQAARLFEQVTQSDSSEMELTQRGNLHYNLGNCYYRLKDYPHAVLAYQRALRFNPADDDAAFNLELTQSKLTDRFDAPSEMFFISWVRHWMQSQNYQTWGHWALAGMLLTLVGIALCLFGRKIWLRKIALACSVFLVIATIVLHIFAAVQHSRFVEEQQVVVMQSCDTYATPTLSGKKVRTLNEGTTLRVVETYSNHWIHIEMPDGREAWMQDGGVEKV